MNVATERTEYTEKNANQEESRSDREEAKGEQTNKGITVENMDTSATKKTESKVQDNAKSTFSEKVKQAVKAVKEFWIEHLSIKNKQGRLGPGQDALANTVETTSSDATNKLGKSNFVQTVVVDTKAAIQENQNLSQADIERTSQGRSDDEMETR